MTVEFIKEAAVSDDHCLSLYVRAQQDPNKTNGPFSSSHSGMNCTECFGDLNVIQSPITPLLDGLRVFVNYFKF